MRILLKIGVLIILFVICIPAQGDILIYNKTVKCWNATETDGEWTVESEKIRGYLVLEVTYDVNGVFETIEEAVQVEFYRDSNGKWYDTVEHDFDFARVVGDNVQWVLVESTLADPEAEMLMLSGRVRTTRIGLSEPNEVALALKGDLLNYDPAEDNDLLQMCQWSLKLNRLWTRWMNIDDLDAEQTYEFLVTILETKGYDEVPD